MVKNISQCALTGQPLDFPIQALEIVEAASSAVNAHVRYNGKGSNPYGESIEVPFGEYSTHLFWRGYGSKDAPWPPYERIVWSSASGSPLLEWSVK